MAAQGTRGGPTKNTKFLVEQAFAAKLIEHIGPDRMRNTHANYSLAVSDNLVPGIQEADFWDDLGAGDGNELEDAGTRPAKFCAAHSSSALAVNAFGLFKRHPERLRLFGYTGFETCRFEHKLQTGISTPNLDFTCLNNEVCIFVESKCSEQLSRKTAAFSPRYTDIVRELAEPAWQELYALLLAEPSLFQYVDAAQLMKHYLGIRYSYREDGRAMVLGYTYWQPANADQFAECVAHQAELRRFAEMVELSEVAFRPLSYAELFEHWSGAPELTEHVRHVTARYGFFVPVTA